MNLKRLEKPQIMFLLALLFVAIIVFLGYQSFKATEQATINEFNQRQLVLARGAAGGIELYFGTLAGELKSLGKISEIQQLDESVTRRELQYTFERLEPFGVNDIGVLDANGVLKYNVAARQIEGNDFSWRTYFQEAREMSSSDPYVIEFIEFMGVEAGQKGILIAVPMFDTEADDTSSAPGDPIAGVVLSTLKLDTIIQKFISPVKSSEKGQAFLIDDEYHVLWAPDRSLFGENLWIKTEKFSSFERVVEDMGAGNAGSGQYSYYKFDELTGAYNPQVFEDELIAYAPVHLGNERWSIGVWAPKQDARQLIQSAMLIQSALMGAIALVLLSGSIYVISISSRVKAEQALASAHAFQQSIIDGVLESIMVIDKDYNVKMMNRAAREFNAKGVFQSEPVKCFQISHQRETICNGIDHPCPLVEVRETGQPVTVVHEHYQNGGEKRFVEIIASPLCEADGSFHGIIESTRDITERKRAEEALQQYTARLRALTTQLVEVTDTERQRLSRELHDQVGQNLTALGINLNIVRAQIPAEEWNLVRSRLDDSLTLVEETAERIRDVMAALRPPVLDDYGLLAALRWYGEQFKWRTGIPTTVEGEEPAPRLEPRVENALFRIGQEALTNVAKHAKATHVGVTVEVENGLLRLVIADDGIGFDPSSPPEQDREPGWGLLTMAERAGAVGGNLHVESSPELGTQITVEVSL